MAHPAPDQHSVPAAETITADLATGFLPALSTTASGVTVVATDGPGGRFAQTVSAMCSVSAQPPLLLACLHGRSPANAAITANGVFCVNVLATQHDHVADTFAGRPWAGKGRWDFSCGHWGVAPSGSPRITDAVASFDCAVDQVIEAGTHLVYIGRVQVVQTTPGTPLIFTGRRYWRPEPFAPSVFAEFPDARPHYLVQKEQQT
jgi:flavin reductase